MSEINNLQIIEPQSFTTTPVNNDDVELSSSVLWVTATDDNDRITGMVVPMAMDGIECAIWNKSVSNALVISDDDSGSTTGYRFILGGGSTTLTLEPGQGQKFVLEAGVGWMPLRSGTFT